MSALMNILFITADQWRGDCLSALDHAHLKTPNLDAIAADGVIFKRHYAQATPCGPSRASLYTGMYMHNHRSVLNGTPLDDRHTNVALEARKSGYKPALFGYTDVSLDPREYSPEDYAVKTYEGVLPGFVPVSHVNTAAKPWLADLKAKGYDVPDNAKEMLRPQSEYPGAENKGKTFAPARFKAEDSSAAFLVGEAIKYLSVRQDKPWFLHMSFLSPHPPYIAPEPFHNLYDANDMSLPVRQETPEKEASLHPWLDYYIFNQRGENYTVGARSLDNISLSELEQRQVKATYFGMMSEIDSQIGRLIDNLKQIGAYDNTLIVFTSDHGDMQGDHWMLSKSCYYEGAFHVPLIVRDPSTAADKSRGTLVEAFTESVDIMPTILDWLDLDIPVQCNGYSLLPFCRDKQPQDWRQEYHAEFDLRSPYGHNEKIPFGLNKRKCIVNIIRGERYKYVHFAGLPPLFFDLKDDPHEFINRFTDPDYQSRVLEYSEKMLTWRMEYDEPALTDFHLGDS
jgi:arylsulfatase A-like enzyme